SGVTSGDRLAIAPASAQSFQEAPEPELGLLVADLPRPAGGEGVVDRDADDPRGLLERRAIAVRLDARGGIDAHLKKPVELAGEARRRERCGPKRDHGLGLCGEAELLLKFAGGGDVRLLARLDEPCWKLPEDARTAWVDRAERDGGPHGAPQIDVKP